MAKGAGEKCNMKLNSKIVVLDTRGESGKVVAVTEYEELQPTMSSSLVVHGLILFLYLPTSLNWILKSGMSSGQLYKVDNEVAPSTPQVFYFRKESDIDGCLYLYSLRVPLSRSKMEANRLSRWELIFLPEGHWMTCLLSTMKHQKMCSNISHPWEKGLTPTVLRTPRPPTLTLLWTRWRTILFFLWWKRPCLQVWTFDLCLAILWLLSWLEKKHPLTLLHSLSSALQ